ncbi:MAG TPA: phosphate ABC transporter substrate-binding protein [Bacilli bacterium]|nr:phosphate ABC transporter substrate-binding protein [Bacilli bacterium]
MFAMKKMASLGLVATLAAGLLVGCGNTDEHTANNNNGEKPAAQDGLSGKVSASGSSALLPLVKQAANNFQDAHTGVTVNVAGGGSGTGLKQVAEGAVDIGNSDVEPGDPYKDAGLVDHVVAVAPFVLVVNSGVNIDNLSKADAAKVLTGEVTNWKEIGGNDQNITIIGRAESSGSRKFIKSALIPEGKDFAKNAIAQDSTGSLRTAVQQTQGAIGYMDAAYAKGDNLKVLKLDGVEYSMENVASGTYTLATNEHMYTKGEPNEATQAFLDYIMSDEFQNEYVEKMNFLPINK